jgi:hypothetical protein
MGMDDEIRRRKQADEAMLRAGLISRLSDSMKAAMGLTPYTGPHSALASATSTSTRCARLYRWPPAPPISTSRALVDLQIVMRLR